ncbi:MAG: hypothetical protein G01um101444_381 [Parcubacteria group bacterium Gr01-1014_44]|nr:MAG: hypothetical protein G01um101444_381 [Parcubacteria group bacterium Gr01-1014_44]
MPDNLNTKQFVDIQNIKDEVVILKNASLRMILEVNSVNFDLKSSDEQTAIIRGFQNFINSLDFPLQIVIQSRRLDIKGYLAKTEAIVNQIDNELLRIQGIEYLRFVKSLTELANIMSKKFYLVVPFYLTETVDSSKGFGERFKETFGSAGDKLKGLNDEDFTVYKAQIRQRSDLLSAGLQEMGLTSRTLGQEELIKMFYNLYNPEF